MESTPALRTWISEVKDLLLSAGLVLSPAPFSAAATPKGIVDLSFTLALQSENTGKYRDDDFLVRASHELTVTVIKKIKPLDQFSSLLDAADIEADVHKKLLPRSALPDTVVTWVRTDRSLSSSREHMLLDMVYRCEVDLQTGADPQE